MSFIRKILTLSFAAAFAFQSFSQEQSSVSGTITRSTDGQPMAGVDVLVKGTAKSVQTDFAGHYTLSVNAQDILVFSYLGMKTQEISALGRTTVDVQMEEEAKKLEDTVVATPEAPVDVQIEEGAKKPEDTVVATPEAPVEQEPVAYTPQKVSTEVAPVAKDLNVASGQEGSVSGTVKSSSDGQLLAGVDVLVKGTTKGVQTDFDGHYTLSVGKKDVLVFSYLGMKTREIPVSGRTTIDLQMEEEAKRLDDVVVTALGITREQKTLTYAAQKVGGEEMTRVKDANLVNSISGKVAGITISRSSAGLGGSVKVTIRGNSSTTNNDPLYVVDGVPMLNTASRNTGTGNPINGVTESGDAVSLINPEDIESMTVLKGASSAALYGNQGSNGVILITTKSGKEGKEEIKLSSSTFVNGMPYMPKAQGTYGASDSGTLSWGDKLGTGQGFTPIPERFFQTGIDQITSFSASSGNKKIRNFISYSNTASRGITPTNDLKRNTITVREIGKFFNDKLEVDVSASYTLQDIANKPLFGYYYNPVSGVFLGTGSIFDNYNGDKYQTLDPSTGLYNQNWSWPNVDIQQNPYWILNNAPTQDKANRIQIVGAVKYDILDWLTIKGRYNYGTFGSTSDRKAQAGTFVAAHKYGLYQLTNTQNTQVYADAILTGAKTFGDFDLTVNIGGAIKNVELGNTENFDSTVEQGLRIPNYFNISNFNTSLGISQTLGDRQQIQSVFGSATLGYKKFLYLDLTTRTDWSSTLAFTKQASVTYPSAGVTFLLSEIEGANLPDWISLSKFRGSIAQVGNALSSFLTAPRYSYAKGALTNPTIGPKPGQDLQPEIKTSFEVGTTWGFLNNRVNIDLTYYRNVTDNQFVQIAAPPSNPMGFSLYGVNAGSILNEGFELTIGGIPIATQDFTWDTSFNLATFNNVVLKLSDELGKQDGKGILYLTNSGLSYNYVLKEGQPYGIIQGRNLEKDAQGRTKIDAKTGKPSVSSAFSDLGHVFPNFTGGWSNTFTYKGISLNLMIDAKVGGTIMSLTKGGMDSVGVSQETADARDKGGVSGNFAVYSGDKLDVFVKTIDKVDARSYYEAAQGKQGLYGASALSTYSATNILLREASLGYTFKFDNSYLKRITASVMAKNLFFFYKEAPIDPNVISATGNAMQGLDAMGLPGYRSLGLNLSFTF